MSEPPEIRMASKFKDTNRNYTPDIAQPTDTIPNIIESNGARNHDRLEVRGGRQGNGKTKNRGKNHGKARWRNGRNNGDQQQHDRSHDHGYAHQNHQSHQHLPTAYSQHVQQGYYQLPHAANPPDYHQRAHRQQSPPIHPYYLGHDCDLLTVEQNGFERADYVHGNNLFHHHGLSPSEQQALEQQKYHLNRPRCSFFGSQDSIPYGFANSFSQDTDPYAPRRLHCATEDEGVRYQQAALDNARIRDHADHHQAYMDMWAYERMRPRFRQIHEDVWQMAMPNGGVQYWYAPRPLVMRAQAAEFLSSGHARLAPVSGSVMGADGWEEGDEGAVKNACSHETDDTAEGMADSAEAGEGASDEEGAAEDNKAGGNAVSESTV